jgi:hypothetical protein
MGGSTYLSFNHFFQSFKKFAPAATTCGACKSEPHFIRQRPRRLFYRLLPVIFLLYGCINKKKKGENLEHVVFQAFSTLGPLLPKPEQAVL